MTAVRMCCSMVKMIKKSNIDLLRGGGGGNWLIFDRDVDKPSAWFGKLCGKLHEAVHTRCVSSNTICVHKSSFI